MALDKNTLPRPRHGDIQFIASSNDASQGFCCAVLYDPIYFCHLRLRIAEHGTADKGAWAVMGHIYEQRKVSFAALAECFLSFRRELTLSTRTFNGNLLEYVRVFERAGLVTLQSVNGELVVEWIAAELPELQTVDHAPLVDQERFLVPAGGIILPASLLQRPSDVGVSYQDIQERIGEYLWDAPRDWETSEKLGDELEKTAEQLKGRPWNRDMGFVSNTPLFDGHLIDASARVVDVQVHTFEEVTNRFFLHRCYFSPTMSPAKANGFACNASDGSGTRKEWDRIVDSWSITVHEYPTGPEVQRYTERVRRHLKTHPHQAVELLERAVKVNAENLEGPSRK